GYYPQEYAGYQVGYNSPWGGMGASYGGNSKIVDGYGNYYGDLNLHAEPVYVPRLESGSIYGQIMEMLYGREKPTAKEKTPLGVHLAGGSSEEGDALQTEELTRGKLGTPKNPVGGVRAPRDIMIKLLGDMWVSDELQTRAIDRQILKTQTD